MSLFDKIIIPLIEPNFKTIDFTSLTGFMGCYTSDPDQPNGCEQFFVAFDNSIQNDYVKDLNIRLSKSPNIIKAYIKVIDNKPYHVCSFFVRPELKRYFRGVVGMPMEHKMKYLKMWTEFDEFAEYICSNTAINLSHNEPLPREDYHRSILDKISRRYEAALNMKIG